jgi:hypothetical protein
VTALRVRVLLSTLFIGWLVLKRYRRCVKLKEWECVQVNHHKDIGKVIEEWKRKGWRLHTYQAMGTPTLANHHLLFEKGE